MEDGKDAIRIPRFESWSDSELLNYAAKSPADRLYALGELLHRGMDPARICDATAISIFFLSKLKNITQFEEELRQNVGSADHLLRSQHRPDLEHHRAVGV